MTQLVSLEALEPRDLLDFDETLVHIDLLTKNETLIHNDFLNQNETLEYYDLISILRNSLLVRLTRL